VSTIEPVFVGIDLTDPFSKCQRRCTRAILKADLSCTFDKWTYARTGSAIVPSQLVHLPYIVAIDGPQGLAGSAGAKMRICERQLRAAGKSSYTFRPIGQPYAGFVRGSVELFYSLYRSATFRIHGMDQEPEANLIEVYPGAAWPVLADQTLRDKKLLEGRKDRHDLLARLGITFTHKQGIEMPPTHDQLDAVLAAYIAYLFSIGKTNDHGEKPFEDTSTKILREGLIVQPVKSS